MRWVPQSRGGRIRLITLGFGLLLIGLAPLQVAGSQHNEGATEIALAAIVVLLGILVTTALLRRQLSIWEGPATAVLAVLVGIALEAPLNVMSVVSGVIVAQGLYGSKLSEVLRVVSFLPVVPLVVTLSESPVGNTLDWYTPQVLGVLPFIPLFALLVYMLKSALLSQGVVKARARFVANLTGDLLAATTVERAMPVLQTAAAEVCRMTPGLVLVAVRQQLTPDGPVSRVHSVIGADLDRPPAEIPPGIIDRLPGLGLENIREVEGISARMAALGLPAHRKWFAHGNDHDLAGQAVNLGLWGVPLTLPERLFGITGSRGNELIEVLREISTQRSSTFTYLSENQNLIRAASRDDVTGLARRPAFLAELERMLDGDAPVALLFVGLDDLAPLTVQRGLATASMVAYRLSRRMTAMVGERARCGRFSDRRFAVALRLPGEHRDDDPATGLADTLRRSLSAPIAAEGGDIRLRIGIGIARTAGDDTGTAWDLVERAAVALRVDTAAPLPAPVRPG